VQVQRELRSVVESAGLKVQVFECACSSRGRFATSPRPM
jgi:hypothetical protein